MDWDSLERRNFGNNSQDSASFKVPVKKVAVSKDRIRRLPDGTVIVLDSDSKKDSDD